MSKLLGSFLTLFLCLAVSAELKLPAVFGDGMVLQQQQPIPVWGWTDAGTEVTVEFKGQVKSVKAGDNGKWMLKLEAVGASAESAELKVKAGNDSKVFTDVLVGEVWLCGGQSNMDYSLAGLTGPARNPIHEPIAEFIRKEIEQEDDPLLRQIKIGRVISPFEEKSEFNGKWEKSLKGERKNFTATGYFFAKELRQKLGVPVGLLNSNWGGTLVEPWIPMSKFQKTESLKKYYDGATSAAKEAVAKWNPEKAKADYEAKLIVWQEKVKEAKEKKQKEPQKPKMAASPAENNKIPSALYNGMIHPLVPYAIKGAIWYQGESNAGSNADEYREHFGALIESWREVWGQEKFYFYWCQLAQFKKPSAEPIDKDGWATVINHQRLTLELPDTGMAVLNDIGEADDIHPKNKIDAGKRLSLWAFKQAYGKDLVYSGPLYKSSKIEGNKVIVTFDNVGSGLMVGKKNLMDPAKEVNEPLKMFQILDDKGKWRWAEAKITGVDTVEVSHPEVAVPVEVRYAWAANAEGANLYNKEGLPASVFATR